MNELKETENLTEIDDDALLENTKDLARKERECTVEVLHHLLEVERRQLFAKAGFSSLFEYAIHELAYSEGAAARRINSMRILKNLPGVGTKIETGALSLTALSQAHNFFRREKLSLKMDKISILHELEGKTSREVERILAAKSTVPHSEEDRISPLPGGMHLLRVTISAELLEKLNELKALLSHRNPTFRTKTLLEIMANDCLAMRRIKAPIKFPKLDGRPPRGRHVPAELKRFIWKRDRGECTYQDPQTGRQCKSRHFLECDHIVPHGRGGKTTANNLRLRCAKHNRLAAIQNYGNVKIKPFVKSMQGGG